MQQGKQETYPYQTGEIDLRKLVKSIKDRKWFIFGFTGFVALLTIVYVLSLPPSPYIVKTAVLKPDQISVLKINAVGLMSETRESIHSDFLSNINNKAFQKKIFIEGDFLSKLNKENEPINDVDQYISEFLSSISLTLGNTVINKESLTNFEEPSTLSMQGNNVEIMSDFLNELVIKSNNKTVSDYFQLQKLMVSLSLNQIIKDYELLLLKAKIERLNKIEELKHATKIAISLGIKENNLNPLLDTDKDPNLVIAIKQNQDVPNWYLYGEKALTEATKLLQEREDDTPFIPELINLKIKKHELESINLDSSGINTMRLSQSANSSRVPDKSLTIVMVSIMLGLFLSCLLSIIMNFLKENETQPTTNTSR